MTDIAMHASDRGIIVGRNGSGKSTLAAELLRMFRAEYPDARIAVMDTKPRWRAVKQANGTRTRKLYKMMAKGDTIPGSVTIGRMDDWSLVWDHDLNPSQSVIVQQIDGSHASNIAFQVAFLERFFKTQNADRPSLVYLDEGHDFFNATAGAKGGSDIVQRCYRAGRERGLATLAGFQRPIGMNLQCLTEVNYCALFAINYHKDVRRMWEMGWPQTLGPPADTPREDHCFRLWRQGSPQAPLYRLRKGSQNGNASKAS